jgi:hypothetical protein
MTRTTISARTLGAGLVLGFQIMKIEKIGDKRQGGQRQRSGDVGLMDRGCLSVIDRRAQRDRNFTSTPFPHSGSAG